MPVPGHEAGRVRGDHVDQRLGVRPRLQRFGRQLEPEAVEVAKAEDAVHRLAGDAPRERGRDRGDAPRRPRGRSGAAMASARVVPREMLDDEPRVERGVVDAG